MTEHKNYGDSLVAHPNQWNITFGSPNYISEILLEQKQKFVSSKVLFWFIFLLMQTKFHESNANGISIKKATWRLCGILATFFPAKLSSKVENKSYIKRTDLKTVVISPVKHLNFWKKYSALLNIFSWFNHFRRNFNMIMGSLLDFNIPCFYLYFKYWVSHAKDG